MTDNLVDKDTLIRQGFRSRYITHLLGPGITDEDGKEWWSQQVVDNAIRTTLLPAFATMLMVDADRMWGLDLDADVLARWEAIRDATEAFQWTSDERPMNAEQNREEALEHQRADANGPQGLEELLTQAASGE